MRCARSIGPTVLITWVLYSVCLLQPARQVTTIQASEPESPRETLAGGDRGPDPKCVRVSSTPPNLFGSVSPDP